MVYYLEFLVYLNRTFKPFLIIKMKTSTQKMILLLVLTVSISPQCTRLGQIEQPANSGTCVCDSTNNFQQVNGREECQCNTNFILDFAGTTCIANTACGANTDASGTQCRCADTFYRTEAGACEACPTGVIPRQFPNAAQTACVSACPAGEVGDAVSPTFCRACGNGCSTCDVNLICTDCGDNTEISATSQTCLVSCSVTYCQTCSATSSTTCIQCVNGYYLNSTNQCQLSAICSDTNTFWDGSTCSCQSGTVGGLGTCNDCTVANCRICSATDACQICNEGFFRVVPGQTCASCGQFCQSCLGENQCLSCSSGYVVINGECSAGTQDRTGQYQTGTQLCQEGCLSCATTAARQCSVALPGFGLVNNVAISCSTTNCFTCGTGTCTQCNFGYRLNVINNCEACTSSNCIQCSVHKDICQFCDQGYRVDPATAQCTVACGDNCLRCGVAGAGLCDAAACAPGSAFDTDTNQCLECLPANCETCAIGDLDTCTQCAEGYFLENGVCIACTVSNCGVCTSRDSCSMCADGFYNSSSTSALVCTALCTQTFPCISCSSGTNRCSTCADGYTLQNDNTCAITCALANTPACVMNQCPDATIWDAGTSACIACTPSVENCARCGFQDQSTCSQCNSNYYLSTLTSCVQCPAACATCLSAVNCLTCNTGYYFNQNAGTCLACSSECSACDRSSNTCSACNSGYTHSDELQACISDTRVTVELVFEQDLDQVVPLVDSIKAEIVSIGFDQDTPAITDPNLFRITELAAGSTQLTGILEIPPGNQTASNSAQLVEAGLNTLATNTGLTITQSTITEGTPSTDDDDDDDLGLILGLTIPLGLILIALIIFIIWKATSGKNKNEKVNGADTGHKI